MSEKHNELGEAVLIVDRRGHGKAVMSLLDGCRCLNGDFILSDGNELSSAMEAMTYLFESVDVEGFSAGHAGLGTSRLNEFGWGRYWASVAPRLENSLA